jgi:hypothetical protein
MAHQADRHQRIRADHRARARDTVQRVVDRRGQEVARACIHADNHATGSKLPTCVGVNAVTGARSVGNTRLSRSPSGSSGCCARAGRRTRGLKSGPPVVATFERIKGHALAVVGGSSADRNLRDAAGPHGLVLLSRHISHSKYKDTFVQVPAGNLTSSSMNVLLHYMLYLDDRTHAVSKYDRPR